MANSDEGRILFRVDAGPAVGLGHIRRCLALAEGLARLGGQCFFVTCDDERIRSYVGALGFQMANSLMSGDSEDLEQVVELAARKGTMV